MVRLFKGYPDIRGEMLCEESLAWSWCVAWSAGCDVCDVCDGGSGFLAKGKGMAKDRKDMFWGRTAVFVVYVGGYESARWNGVVIQSFGDVLRFEKLESLLVVPFFLWGAAEGKRARPRHGVQEQSSAEWDDVWEEQEASQLLPCRCVKWFTGGGIAGQPVTSWRSALAGTAHEVISLACFLAAPIFPARLVAPAPDALGMSALSPVNSLRLGYGCF